MSNSDASLSGIREAIQRVRRDIAGGNGPVPPVEQVRGAVAAAARLYAAYAQATGNAFPPIDDDVSSTEAVVLATALLKARDLNPFDLALWFNRVS